MPRRSSSAPPAKVCMNLVLEPNEAETLDGLVQCLGVSRLDVLMRGLWLLDVSCMLAVAPANATVAVGLTNPATGGLRFSRSPM